MKTRILFLIIICLTILLSCSDDTSVSNPVVVPPQKKFSTRGYGAILDSLYFKVWSDSSWEEFAGFVTFDTVTYATIRDNDFTVYYYNEFGFAGFQFSGLPIVWFDSIPPPPPETLVCGTTYSRETTYGFQGQHYHTKTEQVLEDTTTASVSFGTFSSCLRFKLKSTVTYGGTQHQSNAQTWIAKGPSTIKVVTNSGTTLTMVRGRVNFQGWGMSYPKTGGNTSSINHSKLIQTVERHLFAGNIISEKLLHFLDNPTH